MILTPEFMSRAEKYAVDCGVSLWELMCNAGYELSKRVRETAYKNMAKDVLILCGRGNNGGDGYVCANHLVADGMNVKVANICGEPKSDLGIKASSLLDDRVEVIDGDLCDAIACADIIVDAVFGTGFKGDLHENVKIIFESVSKSTAYKIACDLPSGVNSLTGSVSDGTITFNETVTFHAVKIGCILKPAREYCGEICVCDIGISKDFKNYTDFEIALIDEDFVKENMPKRPVDAHKGTFGKASLVCGSERYKGAAGLSTAAALRSGVGLVELFSDKVICDGLFTALPEAIYSEIDKENTEKSVSEILSSKSDAILIGCGLGNCEKSKYLVEGILSESNVPVIIDADGINSIKENINVVLNAKTKVILTPHPSELSRICGVSLSEIIENRLFYAVLAARKLDCVIMAKGAGTFITDGKVVYLANNGNTALSKGGSGDILAGLLSGFIAQGIEPVVACCIASYILGITAEKLSETASERGIIGSDIISAFPYVFKILGI